MTYVPRYIPAKTNQGWSVVALVVLLTAVCIGSVVVIYQRTYKHPTDPAFHAAGSAKPAGGAPAH